MESAYLHEVHLFLSEESLSDMRIIYLMEIFFCIWIVQKQADYTKKVFSRQDMNSSLKKELPFSKNRGSL